MSQGSGSEWFRFLSRWGLVSGLIYVAMLALFMSLLFSVGGDLALEEAELTAAASRPVMHSTVALLDVLVWLGLGGMLLGFAGLAHRGLPRTGSQAGLASNGFPVRAALLLACAVGQLSGAVGGFVRLYGARLYSGRLGEALGEGAQQQVVGDYMGVWSLVNAHFGLGQLVGGAGLLIVASLVVALGLPRWLALFTGVLGAYGIANQLAFVVSGDFLPLFMPYTLGLIVLHFVLAGLFWRPNAALERSAGRRAAA